MVDINDMGDIILRRGVISRVVYGADEAAVARRLSHKRASKLSNFALGL